MHGSNDLSEEVRTFFARTFGVSCESLAPLSFYERNDAIWASSASPPERLSLLRPPGLRALRRTPDGLKPTSVFLVLLGDRITISRVEIECDELHQLLMGQRIPSCSPDGYVALSYRGDIIGCGSVRKGRLRTMIPTGRRQELLNAVGASPPTEAYFL